MSGKSPRVSTFRYVGAPHSSWAFWLAALLSIGVHVVVLMDFQKREPIKKVARVEEVLLMDMLVMPDLKELEEEKPEELVDEAVLDAPTVDVPSLVDIPMQVPVDTSFLMPVELTLPVKSDPDMGKVMTIPSNIRHGRPNDSSIKNLFNISELDRAPEAITRIPPEVPYGASNEFQEAQVRVGFIVTSQGDAIMLFVVSSTNHLFERPALAAVARWKFRPGMKNGKKVNTRAEQPINFNLKDGQ